MSASFFDDSLPLVTLLTMPEPNEALEARALLTLPQRTQARIGQFAHPSRRRQTLWGRLIAETYANALGAALVEERPYPPYLLLANGDRRALCIAHTQDTIAVGLASALDPVMGLDIETVRPIRSVSGMSRMIFGDAAQWVIHRCDTEGNTNPFFLVWGMKESEIKLNRGQKHYQLTVGNDNTPVVRHTIDQTVLTVTHHVLDKLRLTILTQTQTPTVKRLTPTEVTDRLLTRQR